MGCGWQVGYVIDRRAGNTGGLGALFGIMYAIGHPLPFPEAKPYRRSWSLWVGADTESGMLGLCRFRASHIASYLPLERAKA
jgi:hypothetical protein